jgi:dTDP-4-dehydrorhamnose 3,5-epimerase
MKFNESPIAGVYIIEPELIEDNRGVFFRTFCKEDFEKINFQKEFVQMNHSLNNKGVFRGFHYQEAPYTETKLIRCISGKVYDVVIDLRKNSSTFLKNYSVELSKENRKMILIPDGCAHGFLALEDQTELLYHHTNFYNKQADKGIRYDDPVLNINLPFEISCISEKDRSYPLLDKNFKGIEI